MIKYVQLFARVVHIHILFQINKTADRMYALFAICNALAPSRADDNISSTVKERYGEQFAKMSRG